ncbi:MAG: prolipoprotein diacylglyceryl transferase [Patescibacteria group bacterium]
MNVFLNFYQHLPEGIISMAFHIGSFAVGWYSLMYMLAFLTVYLLLRWRIKKGEGNYKLELIDEFIFYSFLGVLIGGRLGYVIFYNLPYYLANPWTVISPFDEAGKFAGIYGMSYHGGLIGVIIATWYFAQKNKVDFLKWADFVVPAIPAGFFFGRIGNFLNGELYGRITAGSWGMYFSADPLNLRHPSQLYEAFFEGLVLFLILWLLRPCPHPQPLSLTQGEGDPASAGPGEGKRGQLFLLYLFLYGLFRFFIEFFREPDSQIGFVFGFFTLGQILSAIMVIMAFSAIIYHWREKRYNSA